MASRISNRKRSAIERDARDSETIERSASGSETIERPASASETIETEMQTKQSFLSKLESACEYHKLIKNRKDHSINFDESYALHSIDPSLFMLMACDYFVDADTEELQKSDIILQRLVNYKPKTQKALIALYMLSTKMYPVKHWLPKHKDSEEDYDMHLTNFFDTLDDLLDFLKALSEIVLEVRTLNAVHVTPNISEILSKMKIGKFRISDNKEKMIDFHRRVYNDELDLTDLRLPRKLTEINQSINYLSSLRQSDGTISRCGQVEIDQINREKSEFHIWYSRHYHLLEAISKSRLPIDFGHHYALGV